MQTREKVRPLILYAENLRWKTQERNSSTKKEGGRKSEQTISADIEEEQHFLAP